MNEIIKNGVFLDTDGEGYLISDASAAKIVAPWSEAVDHARQLEVHRLGSRLHSLYLRGSVARGRAIAGRSDLDLFAVLFDDKQGDAAAPPPLWRQNVEFRRKFPFVTSVESAHITLASVMGPFHYYRFVMKTSALCIHGEDLLPQIAPCKADAPIAEEWFRIFPHLIDQLVNDLSEANEEATKKNLCQDMMKTFLRGGFLLVMKRQNAYTRDLYPSYECFSHFYPEQERTMWRCLELAVNPTADPPEFLPLVADFASWMRQAFEAEFGALELLPATLLR
jgi:predicted nucleotidyltransferase